MSPFQIKDQAIEQRTKATIGFNQVIEFTCTLASDRSNLIASSSLVNTSGYCVFPKAFSSSCSWYVVNVVRDLRTLRGRSDSPRFNRSDSPKFKGSCRASFIW